MYYGERLNSITHLIGAAFALVGLGALLTVSIQTRDPWMIASFSTFGITLTLLYTISTLYHSFYPQKLKGLFQKLDHISIYLLIGGTYTPYMLVSLRDQGGGWSLMVVWILAVVGILMDIFSKRRREAVQVAIYIVMGWSVVFRLDTLGQVIGEHGLFWLILGGLAYTIGVVFYILDDIGKLTHAHGIWHLFVLMGSVAHFISILGYVR